MKALLIFLLSTGWMSSPTPYVSPVVLRAAKCDALAKDKEFLDAALKSVGKELKQSFSSVTARCQLLDEQEFTMLTTSASGLDP
jgi:hypothetical protein